MTSHVLKTCCDVDTALKKRKARPTNSCREETLSERGREEKDMQKEKFPGELREDRQG